jgi:rhodanese-related sulfurtransferase
VAQYGDCWINIPQETLNQRMDEVPRDKDLILMCNSGMRSYVAFRQLKTAGIDRIANVSGRRW